MGRDALTELREHVIRTDQAYKDGKITVSTKNMAYYLALIIKAIEENKGNK